jgi:pimeloyl-ACP methyl ester carboxylesterase
VERRRSRSIELALGLLLLSAGVASSRVYEPGVDVEWTELKKGLPAIVFRPTGSSSAGTALLLHGVTASKETMVVLGEALAAAGIGALAIDAPGHGASPEPVWSLPARADDEIEAAARALGGKVDLLVGHSMGAYLLAAAAQRDPPRVSAARLAAIGAAPPLPRFLGPALVVVGGLDEVLSARAVGGLSTGAGAVEVRVVPGCDHALEPWHPGTIDAVLGFAGRARVARFRWLLRLVAPLVGTAGAALLLAGVLTPGPRPAAHSAGLGALVGVVAIAVFAVTLRPWIGTLPSPMRFLAVDLPLGLLIILALRLLPRRLREQRWSGARIGMFATAGALVGAAAAAGAGHSFVALLLGLAALAPGGAALLAWFAEARIGAPIAGLVAGGLGLAWVLGVLVPRPL